MCPVNAHGSLNSLEIINIPVLNPGKWFGKTRLREIGESFSAQFLIIEADAVSDALLARASKLQLLQLQELCLSSLGGRGGTVNP